MGFGVWLPVFIILVLSLTSCETSRDLRISLSFISKMRKLPTTMDWIMCSPNSYVKALTPGGAWVAQSVKRQTSAQVMISQLLGSSPTLGSVLTVRSLEPALDSVSPSLSLPLPRSCYVSLSQK